MYVITYIFDKDRN